MKRQINENGFVNIQSFMVRELHLKNAQLMVYAIIYGFSQTQNQECTAGLKYFQEWTNSSERNVINAINILIKKGYIKKTKGSGNKNIYRAIYPVAGTEKTEKRPEKSSGQHLKNIQDSTEKISGQHLKNIQDSTEKSSGQHLKKVQDSTEKNSGETLKKFQDGTEKFAGNNIIYNNNNINNTIYAYEEKIYKLYNRLTGLEVMPQIAADISELLRSGIECDLICEALKNASRINIERRRLWAYAHKVLLRCEKQGIKTLDEFLSQKPCGSRDAGLDASETQRIVDETNKLCEMLESLGVSV